MSRAYKDIELLQLRKLGRAKAFIQPSENLPSSFSLKDKCAEVYDQGQIGSCTANAFCGAYRMLMSGFIPSRLFFYYYERLLETHGKITDSGGDVVDGESYVQKYGICSETTWPYNVAKVNKKPPSRCSQEAVSHKIASHGVIEYSDINSALVQGNPVLLAIQVYESFENPTDGVIPIPDTSTEKLLGGHELVIVGYDDDKSLYTVLNSWGSSWGDGGFCYIPYDYINSPLCVELSIFAV